MMGWQSLSFAQSEWKVGVLAFRGVDKTIQRWQPTIDYLSEHYPEQSFTLLPMSLPEIKEAVDNKSIDFLLTNTGQFVTLKWKYALNTLATLKNKRQNHYLNEFGAIIFTHKDNQDINTLAHLRNRTFAAVSEKAFGGFQMAWREIRVAGLESLDDFKSVDFMGFPQDNIVHAVLTKQVDVGTIRSDLLENMADKGTIDINQIKVLNLQHNPNYPFKLSTHLYPEWPFSALQHVPLEVRLNVKKLLLNMTEVHPASIQGQHGGWSNKFDYRRVNELFRELGINQYKPPENSNLLSKSILTLIFFSIFMLLVFLLKSGNSNFRQSLLLVTFILIITLIALLMMSREYFSSHLQSQQLEAQLLAETFIDEIEKSISIRTSLTQLAAEKFNDQLIQNRHGPSPMLFEEIREYISKFVTDFKMSAVTDSYGVLQMLDESSPFGSSCEASVNEFQSETHKLFYDNIVVHGKGSTAHYDTMVKLDENGRRIFFVGYQMHHFVKYLEKLRAFGFEAIVVKRNTPTQIEFSADGVKHSKLYGSSISENQLDSALYESAIDGTNWRLEIFSNDTVDAAVEKNLLISFGSLALFALLIYFYSIYKIIKGVKHIDELIFHANTDQLTKLFNRRYLDDFVTQQILQANRNQSQFAIMYIDLDGFKIVNDMYGHDTGDKVLIEVSNRFSQHVRSNECLARIGGDEFCIVVPSFKNQQELTNSAQRLLETIQGEMLIDDNSIKIGFSIGIAIFPIHGDSYKALKISADTALYEVKSSGKGNFCFALSD